MKSGPKPVVSAYAASLGISRKQLYRLGRVEKVKAMNPDLRTILVNQAKRYRRLPCSQEEGQPREADGK